MNYNDNEEGHNLCFAILACIINLFLFLTCLPILLCFCAIVLSYYWFYHVMYMLASVLQYGSFITLKSHFDKFFFFSIYIGVWFFFVCLILILSRAVYLLFWWGFYWFIIFLISAIGKQIVSCSPECKAISSLNCAPFHAWVISWHVYFPDQLLKFVFLPLIYKLYNQLFIHYFPSES